MNYIIYDLEATCWENRPRQTQEIIEIGAVKMNEYGEVIDTFNRFVHPLLNPTLSYFCKNLTSIEQEDIDNALTFPTVVELFQDWIEIFDEEYLLCSWGAFDKKMLIRDCQLHDLEYDWVEPHINMKEQYRSMKRLRYSVGLKKAVAKEGLEFYGIHHRGIDDAKNAARIFGRYLGEWAF